MAGATTESASIGTASDALQNMGLEASTLKQLQANITVTYLFGMTLVVFFSSKIAPRLLKVKDFKAAAKVLEKELGADSGLEFGQFEFLNKINARVYRVEADGAADVPIKEFEKRYGSTVTFQQVYRNGDSFEITPDLVLKEDDLVTLFGLPESVLETGRMLGKEVSHEKIEKLWSVKYVTWS